ncbi:MAG: chaperone modulator CbpM [Anaerolineales bacterium]|nr:chaperone modulator CbpM [Anaerolineales bacterium]
MVSENTSPKRYWFSPYEGYEARSQRRLQDDLGVDEAAAEAILHLRSQVIELQSRIRQLEAELTAQYASQHMRLSHYRDVYYEATWIELEFQD